MTSAIMNPVALPVTQKAIQEKKDECLAKGIILPENIDDETFVTLFGLGSTLSRPGKEMEAIRAANLLTNNDPHGGAWIHFNKPAGAGVTSVVGVSARRTPPRISFFCQITKLVILGDFSLALQQNTFLVGFMKLQGCPCRRKGYT